MRTIGRWSIASIINLAVSATGFAAALGALVAICVMLAVPFVRLPITVTVPVSFTLDTPDQILGGRPGFAFEAGETRRAPAPRSRSIERIDGSLRVPSSSRWFIAANGAALIAILAYVFVVLGKLRGVLRTLIVDGQPFVAANAARIRFIGLAVIAGEFARTVVVYAENVYARTHLAIPGVTFDVLPRLSVSTVVLG